MWDVSGERDATRVDDVDDQLLIHCARFEVAHSEWLGRIAAGAGEAEADGSAILVSLRAQWLLELQVIRATKAQSLPGIEAKLAVLRALRTWKDTHDIVVLRMHAELCAEREELARFGVQSSVLAGGERWPFGVPPEPLRSWLTMFGGSSGRRRPPDGRSQHRRTGSQD